MKIIAFYRSFWMKNRQLLLAMLILALSVAVSFAQTATPIPNIEIPTGDMIVSLNQWLAIFGPIILFIGMIPVALGLLQYVVGMFRRSFSGGGGSK